MAAIELVSIGRNQNDSPQGRSFRDIPSEIDVPTVDPDRDSSRPGSESLFRVLLWTLVMVLWVKSTESDKHDTTYRTSHLSWQSAPWNVALSSQSSEPFRCVSLRTNSQFYFHKNLLINDKRLLIDASVWKPNAGGLLSVTNSGPDCYMIESMTNCIQIQNTLTIIDIASASFVEDSLLILYSPDLISTHLAIFDIQSGGKVCDMSVSSESVRIFFDSIAKTVVVIERGYPSSYVALYSLVDGELNLSLKLLIPLELLTSEAWILSRRGYTDGFVVFSAFINEESSGMVGLVIADQLTLDTKLRVGELIWVDGNGRYMRRYVSPEIKR